MNTAVKGSLLSTTGKAIIIVVAVIATGGLAVVGYWVYQQARDYFSGH